MEISGLSAVGPTRRSSVRGGLEGSHGTAGRRAGFPEPGCFQDTETLRHGLADGALKRRAPSETETRNAVRRIVARLGTFAKGIAIMAEILTLGLTHFPLLMFEDKRMALILKKMLQNPALPPALRDPANWPDGMRAEWGDDEGEAAAVAHRAELVECLNRTRQALDDFNPDFVIMWGDDQYENFREDVIPPYCVMAHDKFEFSIKPDNVWGEPNDKIFTVDGQRSAAKNLTTRLIEEGFDTAYSYKPLHMNLGHAFANAIYYLDLERRGFPYPLIPMSVNCYGRRVICQRGSLPDFEHALSPGDLDPPAPTPRRLFDLGGAIARILRESPGRVALIASSGWSHAFLVPKFHYLHPDTDADRSMYEALVAGNYTAWRDYPADRIEDSGQQELLNWMCLVGAMNELKKKPEQSTFMETWIFNSSKTFLIA